MAITSRDGVAAPPVARAASDRPNADWYIDKAVQALVFLGGDLGHHLHHRHLRLHHPGRVRIHRR